MISHNCQSGTPVGGGAVAVSAAEPRNSKAHLTGPPPTDPLLAALAYAEMGWRVLPLHRLTAGPDGGTVCSCPKPDCGKSRGKHPRFGEWSKLASAKPEQVQAWWKQWPGANVGVCPGSGSGVVAIDIDSDEGEALLASMAAGDLPTTLEYLTGNGRRLFYAIPEGLETDPATTPFPATDGGGEALRLMSTGSQCVMPPSSHYSGTRYEWSPGRAQGDIEAAPMPSWLIAEMCHPADRDVHQADAGAAWTFPAEGGRFNQRGDWWADVLAPAGWTPAGGRDGVQYYTRPGKSGGVSATVGHCRAKDGTPALFVFSGSVPELTAQKSYDKFGAYARLFHRGDFKTAAADLAANGYATGPRGSSSSPTPGGSPPGPGANGSAAARRLVTRPCSEIDAEEVRWLWAGRIPYGMLSEIMGDPGCGKSTITADIAAAVTTGRPLPGGTATEPAAVLILNAEDSAAHLTRPRLEAAGADLRLVHVLDHVEAGGKKFPLTLPGDFDLVEAAVREHAVRLIIIDPLNAFLSAKVEANDDKDVRSQVMYPLRELAEATGVAVVLVRHLNKGSGKAVYRGGGSIGFTGAVRASLAAGKTDDGRRVLVCNKMNVAIEPPGIEYELVRNAGAASIRWGEQVDMTADELFDMRPGPGTSAPRSAAMEFLAAALAGGPRKATELYREAEAAGHCGATLRRGAKDLAVVKKKLTFGGYSEWSLPQCPTSAGDAGPTDAEPVDDCWRDHVLAALAEVAAEVGIQGHHLTAHLIAAGTPFRPVALDGLLRQLAAEGLVTRHERDGARPITWSLPGGRPPTPDNVAAGRQ